MPLFYLHVCNGDGFTEDELGHELPNLEAARHEAIQGLRSIVADEMKNGILNMASFIEIEDEHHHLLMTVPFGDAVDVATRIGKRPER